MKNKDMEAYNRLSSIICYSKLIMASKNISKNQLEVFISQCEAEYSNYKNENNHVIKGLVIDLEEIIVKLQKKNHP